MLKKQQGVENSAIWTEKVFKTRLLKKCEDV